MSFKTKFFKSAILATGLFSASQAQASLVYSLGLGGSAFQFEFNDKLGEDVFGIKDSSGNNILAIPALGSIPAGSPAFGLKINGRLIGNQPMKVFSIEAGVNKSFKDLSVLDRNFFLGAALTGGMGRLDARRNPVGDTKFMLGSKTLWSYGLNLKFGLENSYSKIYGLTGLTYVKMPLPYDVLVIGSDFLSCSGLASAAYISKIDLAITGMGTAVAPVCKGGNVSNATANVMFANLGFGAEFNLAKDLAMFIEYQYLMQLNKSKKYKVSYVNTNIPTAFTANIPAIPDGSFFEAQVKTKTAQTIKIGARYYFH